ncbi:MAG: hypothetical protein RL027_641 [Pseudomonadota bacterium]
MNSAFKIIFSEEAKKSIKKIDKNIILKIITKFENDLLKFVNPRDFGKALKGDAKLWRYRVGDYRIICEINDNTLVVLIITVGHRKEIYK